VWQCVPQNTLCRAIPCTVEKALDHPRLGTSGRFGTRLHETWRCDFCNDLFHPFDLVSASMEARGDNVRMQSHKFDGHTETKRTRGAPQFT
jgi:hypothetical protein